MWEDQFFSNQRFVAKKGSFQDSYFSFDYFCNFTIYVISFIRGFDSPKNAEIWGVFFLVFFEASKCYGFPYVSALMK